MKTSRIAALAVSAALGCNSMAQAASEAPLQVSYPNDGAMTCAELLTEAARMDEIMGVAQNSQNSAQSAGRAAELGTSVAINGALYSGALGAVPGLGVFANGAGMFAKRSAADKAKKAEERKRNAETRRAIVAGLYQGKNCAAQQAIASTPAADANATAVPVATHAPRRTNR